MNTKKQLCEWQEPSLIAKELIKAFGESGFAWLDGDGSKLGKWVILAANPIEQICCHGRPQDINSTNPFKAIKKLQPGHWTGWLSYEAGAWVEPSNPWKKTSMATLWIASHDPILKFDLINKQLWIEGLDENRIKETQRWLEGINIQKNKYTEKIKNIKISLDSWEWITSKEEYGNQVNTIKDLICKGDLFQANLSACCSTQLVGEVNPIDIFLRLRENCPSPFGGLLIGGDLAKGEAIISTSPERFLQVTSDGIVETRPIKGTRPRKKDPGQDFLMAAELITSSKDRAENIMIVDLLRNDLGKVCTPGSICVPEILNLESYSQVHHLTSSINGKLKSNKTWVDLFEACWPGGSITGAPKIRACQRIYEMEKIERGAYCGSFIKVDWTGAIDSNILIRSLILKENILTAYAGCGIVADSEANNEAEELSWKILPLLKSLS